ncbi:MAG: hypothetical protein ABEL04_06115 [Salinibacter sp.]|uniref:exo-rhamnogalacturonan lyase family protein n=1 Tax=Salinibacter sp. TaxID=2065818 RepID=UPI0035D3DCD4
MFPVIVRHTSLRAGLGALLAVLLLGAAPAAAADRIPITVEAPSPGAPLTVGLPFPQGALHSPDHVRVLTPDGREVPSQVTTVTTWEPADSSLKWVWVFFFAGKSDRYVVEYGPDVRRAPITGDRVTVVNDQTYDGFAEITTGPLRARIQHTAPDTTGSGFLDRVQLDLEGNGFEADDVIATGPQGRGSFLDLVDPKGLDSSRAVVEQTFVEKGSGPLHAIVRVEGEYRYGRDDNNPSPFTLRIHAYAGKPYLRVLHTLTYTGEPDRHPPIDGQHGLIATSPHNIVSEDSLEGDPRWTQANDRIAAAGLALNEQLNDPVRYRTALRGGNWWDPNAPAVVEGPVDAQRHVSVVQTGPMRSDTTSSATRRIDNVEARLIADSTTQRRAARAVGWMDVRDDRWGISVGVRHFSEEYPKELSVQPGTGSLTAYHWSPAAPPMNFARTDAEEDADLVDNFATGTAKTTELIYAFHPASTPTDTLQRTMRYVIDPPVAHAPPQWYADSRVYGPLAPRSEQFAAYERGLQYKFDWWRFNQKWEPWWGMFYYGDGKTYYFRDRWFLWTNNEPATDFMWWLHFLRTGNREAYLTALSQSRHAMDVDNVHWPTGPTYRGDTNSAIDYFETLDDSSGTPYLGMGRRHARNQWAGLMSAHVWTPGWLAAYYLAGVHRGLDVARLTADYYQRRIFGEHGLTGRRLYLSVWNLAAVYDATKDPALRKELDDRVDRMIRLQEKQGGNMIIDRYGYTQVYVANGLRKYIQLTGDEEAKAALVRHARFVRDTPPLDHQMESYLSSISTLLAGYGVSKDTSLFREAVRRAQVLKTENLTTPVKNVSSQAALVDSLTAASHLPEDRRRGGPGIWRLSSGLRVFGWTHIYNVPYLVYWLKKNGVPDVEKPAVPAAYR